MTPASRNLLTGAAGLGYVIAAGVENMELLSAPALGSSAAAIRDAYADRALAAVTALAGVASLAFYCVFVVGLTGRSSAPWARAALLGGIAGAILAVAGIAASAPLVAGSDLTNDSVRVLHSLQISLRFAAGPCMALFLLGSGLVALRSRALPPGLARTGCAIAAPLLLAPAALSEALWAQVAAMIAFGLHALWIWLVSLWLSVGQRVAPTVAVRRAAFLMLVLAAGLVGAALLALPGASGSFFAWSLGPEPLAAFAGGVYVGAAALYAAGLRAGWRQARPLVAGAVVLSVSVFAITLIHLEVFDLDRLQAWAWLVLFAGFAVATIALLLIGGRPEPRAPVVPWARWVLGAAAALLGATGVVLWIDPAAGPFALPALGGRFAGSWVVMLGVLAGWAAVANGREEARTAALALVALAGGALAAAGRTGLEPSTADAAYVAALALLVATGLAVLRGCRAARTAARPLLPAPARPARARRMPVGRSRPGSPSRST